MNFFNEHDLSNVFTAFFINAFPGQDVKVMVAPFGDNEHGLIFKVKHVYLDSYNNEKTIFGKAIRLLIYLEDNYQLYSKMQKFGISKVLVTEAPAPELTNQTNTAKMDMIYLKKLFGDIAQVKATSTAYTVNSVIKTFINEQFK